MFEIDHTYCSTDFQGSSKYQNTWGQLHIHKKKLNILSITLFVLNTLGISILGLIFYILNNGFLIAMIIYRK